VFFSSDFAFIVVVEILLPFRKRVGVRILAEEDEEKEEIISVCLVVSALVFTQKGIQMTHPTSPIYPLHLRTKHTFNEDDITHGFYHCRDENAIIFIRVFCFERFYVFIALIVVVRAEEAG